MNTKAKPKPKKTGDDDLIAHWVKRGFFGECQTLCGAELPVGEYISGEGYPKCVVCLDLLGRDV